jgi:hypothetical protein
MANDGYAIAVIRRKLRSIQPVQRHQADELICRSQEPHDC